MVGQSQCHWLHAVWGMVRGVVGTCMNWWPGMRPGTRDRFHWLCAVVIIDWRRVRCMMRTIRQWEDHLSPCAQTVSNHLLLPLPVGLNLSFPWEITTMYLHRHTRAATIRYHYWLNDCLVDFYAELQSAGEREISQCVETHWVIPTTWLQCFTSERHSHKRHAIHNAQEHSVLVHCNRPWIF